MCRGADGIRSALCHPFAMMFPDSSNLVEGTEVTAVRLVVLTKKLS